MREVLQESSKMDSERPLGRLYHCPNASPNTWQVLPGVDLE